MIGEELIDLLGGRKTEQARVEPGFRILPGFTAMHHPVCPVTGRNHAGGIACFQVVQIRLGTIPETVVNDPAAVHLASPRDIPGFLWSDLHHYGVNVIRAGKTEKLAVDGISV